MKILILIIYSNNEEYIKMLELQRSYIHLHNNFEVYFIEFKENLNSYAQIDNDFIFINGKEERMKITEKTIKSLEFLINDKQKVYDFVIRTNISTIINLKLLYKYLLTLPKNNIYKSGNVLTLNWLDHTSNITDDKLFGTIYASGTNIIFSFDVVKHILKNKDKIRYDIIDDVSFGIYINNYLPYLINDINENKPSFYICNMTTKLSDTENKIFIRNRVHNYNRNNDYENMEKIINYLELKKNELYSYKIIIILLLVLLFAFFRFIYN
jgi:hypothetical protein